MANSIDGTDHYRVSFADFKDDFFGDSKVNEKAAIAEAGRVFQEYNQGVSKRLALDIQRLKEANTELRILTEASDTINRLKKKAEAVSLAHSGDDAKSADEASNIVLTHDYSEGLDEETGALIIDESSEVTKKQSFRFQDSDGNAINPTDEEGNPVSEPLTSKDLQDLRKAIAAIRFYSRDTESGELSIAAGETKLETIISTDEGDPYARTFDLEDLRAMEGIFKNMIESLSPLTTQLANDVQNTQTQSQTASNAGSTVNALRRDVFNPYVTK